MDDPKIAFGFYVVFLISTVVHEAAHAWSALKLGDPTAYYGGQVSLDPMPHIRREPMGMVVIPIVAVFMIGFPIGFAHAPYDPYWAARYPKRAAWMALAGPVSNLLLAALAFTMLKVGLGTGFFEVPARGSSILMAVGDSGSGVSQAFAMFASLLLFMNVLLAVFNLLPFPPLDGGSVLPLFMPRKLLSPIQRLYQESWAPMLGIITAWLLLPRVIWPVYRAILETLHGV